MECLICCEKFTKQTRKEIKCPSMECGKSCCSTCMKRYLIDGEDITPKCMFCRKELSYSFVREHFPKSWNNKDYLCTRTKHLMSREKSLLPQSQQDVKEELERRERETKIFEIDQEIDKLLNNIRDLELQKRLLHRHKKSSKPSVVTVRKCCKEECKGFLEENSKCGICKTKTCSECGEEENKEHVCNPETKKTYKMIEKTSRPCPKCGIPIHKWQGCNQMYCTQCGCMFDYLTGRLEKGFFHNPHYFDALNNGTIDVIQQRNECGRMTDRKFYGLVRTMERIVDNMERSLIYDLRRLVPFTNHIREVTMPTVGPNIFDATCRNMRRNYLLNELSEEEWFKNLKSIEKKREKNKEVYQLLELFVDVSRDIISNIGETFILITNTYIKINVMQVKIDAKDIKMENGEFALEYCFKNINQVKKITEFINTRFSKIYEQTGLVTPELSTDWRLMDSLRIS